MAKPSLAFVQDRSSQCCQSPHDSLFERFSLNRAAKKVVIRRLDEVDQLHFCQAGRFCRNRVLLRKRGAKHARVVLHMASIKFRQRWRQEKGEPSHRAEYQRAACRVELREMMVGIGTDSAGLQVRGEADLHRYFRILHWGGTIAKPFLITAAAASSPGAETPSPRPICSSGRASRAQSLSSPPSPPARTPRRSAMRRAAPVPLPSAALAPRSSSFPPVLWGLRQCFLNSSRSSDLWISRELDSDNLPGILCCQLDLEANRYRGWKPRDYLISRDLTVRIAASGPSLLSMLSSNFTRML